MISGNSSSGSRKDLRKSIKMDFVVKRGDTFSYTYDVTYIDDNGVEQVYDLTGCYAQMQIKKKKTDISPVIRMDILFDIAAGTITFSKIAEEMIIPAGKYWFDLEVKNADDKNITWIEGGFKIVQDVTEWIEEFEEDIEIFLNQFVSIITGGRWKEKINFGLITKITAWGKTVFKVLFVQSNLLTVFNYTVFKHTVAFFQNYLFTSGIKLKNIVMFLQSYKLSTTDLFLFNMDIAQEYNIYVIFTE